jgi:hypothetical protein
MVQSRGRKTVRLRLPRFLSNVVGISGAAKRRPSVAPMSTLNRDCDGIGRELDPQHLATPARFVLSVVLKTTLASCRRQL